MANELFKGPAMPMLTGALQVYSAYQELTAPDVDFDILNLQAEQTEIEADVLKTQVEEEATRIREEFIAAVGAATYGAARRGVKVGEGDIAEDIEESAGALGKDIQAMREGAGFRAGQMKRRAEFKRGIAKDVKRIGQAEKVGRAARSIIKAGESFGKI